MNPVDSPPQGKLTLLFTDIEGSSDLWEKYGERFRPVLEEHHRIMRRHLRAAGGFEVKTEGDAFFVVFPNRSGALLFMAGAQLELAATDWNALLPSLRELRVRMGGHVGEPLFCRHPDGQADYLGPVVNRAARVGACGHGAQCVVSDAVRRGALEESASFEAYTGPLGPEEWVWEDLGLHRLKGVGEEHLWQFSIEGLPQRFPPVKTLPTIRHNLPFETTPFVGRELERQEILERLRSPDCRVLTLLGFGGQGKTRLALQTAREVLSEYPDGVWWVPLEEVTQVSGFWSQLAGELRLVLVPAVPAQNQVKEFLAQRRVLLLLDNTEQIDGAGKAVADLVAAAPHCQCLVTTRRALGIGAEMRYTVPPLNPQDAISLFTARAQAQVPDWALDQEEATPLAELCRRLDYVPLALELAASRIRVMTPGQILERLDDHLRLLVTRSPDLPARQRALRGAIDWSYDLLLPEDQSLLAQLCLFQGGFSLEDAEAVCQSADVLTGVEELLHHSFLQETRTGGVHRFTLGQSVQAYAAEKFEAEPRSSLVRSRFVAHFVALGRSFLPRLRTREEGQWLERLKPATGNLDAALRMAVADGNGESATVLALAVHDLHYRLGHWEAAGAALRCLQGMVEGETVTVPAFVEWALRRAGLALDGGETAEASRYAALALQKAEHARGGTARLCANAANTMGLCWYEEGRWPEAQGHFEAALASGRTAAGSAANAATGLECLMASPASIQAMAMHNLARLASRAKDWDRALDLYQQAVEIRACQGDFRGQAETLGNMGAVAYFRSQPQEARRLYLQSLRLRVELEDDLGVALMLHNLAELAEEGGDMERAVLLYLHAERLFARLGSAYVVAPRGALARMREKLAAGWQPVYSRAAASEWEPLLLTEEFGAGGV